jgi:YfiH family protein
MLEQNSLTDTYKLTLKQYAQIANVPVDSLQTVKQVHSDTAIIYAGGKPQVPPPEADAVIVTNRKGYGGVFVADCLAVVLFSPGGNICAAVHAGWRGALQRIVSKTAAAICKLGIKPGDIAVVLATGIGIDSYRIGEELLPLFGEQGYDKGPTFRTYPDGWHLDLRQTVAQDLVEFGINPQHIYDSGLCNYKDHSLLWSFRRDGKKSLRNLVFCGWHSSSEKAE